MPSTFMWALIGLGVLVAIALLSIPLNRRKSTAYVTIRLAEAARAHGEHATALALYQHALHLAQRPPEVLEGIERAREEDTTPRLPAEVVLGTVEQWRANPEVFRALLERSGYQGPWPQLGETSDAP